MRAGANEFFTWPPPEETFHGAVRRSAARRETTQGARAAGDDARVLRREGRSRHDDAGGQLRGRSRATDEAVDVIVDLKPGLGEVALFLGVRPRYSLLDALDNLHRLDKRIPARAGRQAQVRAGDSRRFRSLRPARRGGCRHDRGAVPRFWRTQYDYILIDAGSQINSCSLAALYAADTMFLVANPDVPSVRNAQRLLDRVRQLGACGERVRVLLNRAAEPFPIPPKQIEGRSAPDSPHVPERLQDRVDRPQLRRAAGADRQHGDRDAFDSFTRRIVDPEIGDGAGDGAS